MGGSASSPLLVLFQQTINEALSGIRKKGQTRLILTLSPFLVVHPQRNWNFRSESKWASLAVVWSQLFDVGCTRVCYVHLCVFEGRGALDLISFSRV